MHPDVILFDEPCSALDPISTLAIEELMQSIVKERAIVIVTHNMEQASRAPTERRSSIWATWSSTARRSRSSSILAISA